MCAPGVGEVPETVPVPIVDLDLAVGRTRCEAVAVAVEGGGLDHVPVAMLQEDKVI